ncbi:MAG TPA: hypothetical protein VIM79_13125 [Niastella sp.]
MRRSIVCMAGMLLMISCTNRTPQQRLAAFVNDPENKIVQSIQVGDVKAIAKFLPAQYRDPQFQSSISNEEYCYFNVRFEKNTTEKPANEKLLYLNFDMQNDFTVFCAGDSISPVICQKIETGISGRYEYMVAFENSNDRLSKNDFTLYYKDKIFGLGVIAFVYSRKDIQQVPKI